MKADSARRFFLDLDDLGNVILSAPKRTEFDEREKWQHGSSDILTDRTPEAMAKSHSLHVGFKGAIEMGGRLFFITIQSVAKEGIES